IRQRGVDVSPQAAGFRERYLNRARRDREPAGIYQCEGGKREWRHVRRPFSQSIKSESGETERRDERRRDNGNEVAAERLRREFHGSRIRAREPTRKDTGCMCSVPCE